MTSYRYLGYGTTDNNGVAHLKKNASGQDVNGYVGTGAGEVDVIASLDNPIIEGSIVSETFTVYDYYKYDDGTQFWTEYSSPTVERVDDYIAITDADKYGWIGIPIDDSMKIEFDARTIGNVWNWNFIFNKSIGSTSGGTGTGFGAFNGSQNVWYHVEITIQGSTITMTCNNHTETITLEYPKQLGISVNAGITEADFKNYKSYYI